MKITTATNRSKSPVSQTRLEKSDIMIAARSFRNFLGYNSFGDNSRRSARSFCGAVTLRSCCTTLLTESHAQCVHSDSHAPRTNSIADDRHSLLCCLHSSALKAVPRKHVRIPLRELDSNAEARDSPRVQMFASHPLNSCTAQLVSPLSLESSIVSRVWQHRATIGKSARTQSLLAAHDTCNTLLYFDCDIKSSESNRLFLNPFPKLSPSQSQVVIFDRFLNSSLFPVQRLEAELSIVMSSLTYTQLFAYVPTGLVSLDTAREQLKSFPIIDVVIEVIDQEFTKSIAEKHFVTVCEFLLDAIAKFGPDLGGLYSAALLYFDEQPRRSRVRLQSGVTDTIGVYHFRIFSMHAEQSIVNLFVRCFKNLPQKQQPIARYFAFAKEHELETLIRNTAQVPAFPDSAAQVSVAPLVTSVHPLMSPPIFGSSSSSLHFSNVLLPPTSRASGSTSSSLSHTSTSSLFVSPSFSESLTPNLKARKTTHDKSATKIETSQVLQKAASRYLESVAYAFAIIEKSTASPERVK